MGLNTDVITGSLAQQAAATCALIEEISAPLGIVPLVHSSHLYLALDLAGLYLFCVFRSRMFYKSFYANFIEDEVNMYQMCGLGR